MNSVLVAILVIGGIGLIFGCLLAYASIVFEVKKDERIPLIIDVLPGANCGACGYAGCSAYASAIVNDNVAINSCSVGKDAVAKKISDIMGVEAQSVERVTAKVLCGGTCDVAKDKYTYFGVLDCVSASKLAGGAKECPSGCLGLGSCKNVCQFDAISIINGIAVVDSEKCTACGQCVTICPKNIIELVPDKAQYFVRCANYDKGSMVNKYCSVGCIGCKICEKACSFDAIHVENNYAKINYDNCINCGACAEKCPRKIICKLHS